MSIKFSIHVPVYNVEEFIEECLDSILNQNYENYEVIIIDDGSTDCSGEICERYAKKDERIKVYHQQNQGLLITRRNALKCADGDFVIFCDSDDKLKENALSEIARYINEYSCDMLIYRYEKFGSLVVEGSKIYKSITDISHNNKEELMNQIAANNDLNNLCSKAVRLSKVDVEEDYEKYRQISNGEDLLQSLPLFENCKKILYVPDIFYCYRVNDKSITRKVDVLRYKQIDFVRRETLNFLKKNDKAFEKHIQAFSECYIEMMMMCSVEVATAKISREEKVKILNEIRNLQLFKESLKKAKCFKLGYKRKILLLIMKSGSQGLLNLFLLLYKGKVKEN